MMRKTKMAAAAGIATVALIGTGAGVAMADSATPAPNPTTPNSTAPKSSSAPDAHHKHRKLMNRVEHGEVTVGGAKPKVLDLQRGSVEKVSSNSITVRSKDGFVGTYAVNGNTKVHKEKKKSSIGQVANGDQVQLRAVKSGSTATAQAIGDRGPAKH